MRCRRRSLPVVLLMAGVLAGLAWVGVGQVTAHATEIAQNPAFRLKLLLIASAGSNAVIFHRSIFKTVSAWNVNAPAPPPAKIAAVLSLMLWTGVIGCGRLLAYL